MPNPETAREVSHQADARDGQSKSSESRSSDRKLLDEVQQLRQKTGDGSNQSSSNQGKELQAREERKAAAASSQELQNVAKELEDYKRNHPDKVEELSTGDCLVRTNGREMLFMPDGSKLTVNPDGSYQLKSREPCTVTSRGGRTTVSFPNGDTVELDGQGVLGIYRGHTGVSFMRCSPPKTQTAEGDRKKI